MTQIAPSAPPAPSPLPAPSAPSLSVRCWEDVAGEQPRRVGPLSVAPDLLERYLTLVGEYHPLHTDSTFARAVLGHPTPVVPGSLLPGVVAGWLARHEGPVAVVGLRSMHWDFVRPLGPGQRFWCEVSVRASEVVDPRTGTIAQTRRLVDDQGRTHAIGRLQLLLLRRDAFAETVGSAGPNAGNAGPNAGNAGPNAGNAGPNAGSGEPDAE